MDFVGKVKNRKSIKKMVEEGTVPIGCLVGIPAPELVEYAAVAGYDFVWIDMEHELFTVETIKHMVRAAEAAGIIPVLRVVDTSLLLALADFGVKDFCFPHVRTAEQVRNIVDILRFPPMGRRGAHSSGRLQGYGCRPYSEYHKTFEDDVTIWIMIEDEEGIENRHEIVSVPGFDYLILGYGDISLALGHPGEPDHPDCKEARRKCIEAAEKAGVKHEYNGAPYLSGNEKSYIINGWRKDVEKLRASAEARVNGVNPNISEWPPL